MSDAGKTGQLAYFAPAKINLYLHVTGKRADGYHLLDSLVVFADVGDRLSFQPDDKLSLTLIGPNGPFLSTNDDNIVLRAAKKLAEKLGREPKAAITLEKLLPVAAGIGGGSADAAATLRGLLALWGEQLDAKSLSALGLTLGADVPVCLAGRAMQMAGIGEQLLSAVKLPPAWLVLVNPRIALSTPMVFKTRIPSFTPAAPFTAPPKDAQHLAEQLRTRKNDLSQAAESLEPTIGMMLSTINATPNCLLARMSGSGATCFGLYGSAVHAEQAAALITAQHPDWWVAAAEILV